MLAVVLLLLVAKRTPVTATKLEGAKRHPKPSHYSGVTPKGAGARPIANAPTEPAKLEPIPTAPAEDARSAGWVLIPNAGLTKDKIPLLSGFELAAVIEFRAAANAADAAARDYIDRAPRIYGAGVDDKSIAAVRAWLLQIAPWKALTVTADSATFAAWPEHITRKTPAIYVLGMPGRTSFLSEIAPRPEQMTKLWLRRGLLA